MPLVCFKFNPGAERQDICANCGTHANDHFPPLPPPIIPSTIIEDVTKIMQPFLDRQSIEREVSDVCTLAAAWIARCPDLKPSEACALALDTHAEIERKVKG